MLKKETRVRRSNKRAAHREELHLIWTSGVNTHSIQESLPGGRGAQSKVAAFTGADKQCCFHTETKRTARQ